jgi:hypothetical protein
LIVGTFDTDFVLVKEERLEKALAVLEASDLRLPTPDSLTE